VTLPAAIGWSLLKSLAVTGLGLPLAVIIERCLRGLAPAARRLVWALLLLPCFTPALMVGYCYRDTSISLVPYPLVRELLYTVVLAAQAIPVAVVLLRFAPPPPVSETAIHCRGLLPGSAPPRWSLWLQSRSRSLIPAASILFLISFQEADLAALMQVATWTEWLYMHHAGGLSTDELLKASLPPLLIQLPVAIPILWWMAHPAASELQGRRPHDPTACGRAAAFFWIGIAASAVCMIPAWQLIQGARQGWPALLQQPSTWREILDAGLIAASSCGLALLAGWVLVSRKKFGSVPWEWPLLILAMVPGLSGTLNLAVLLAVFFQISPLAIAYDSPLPLLAGETLAVLPRVLILLNCVSRMRCESADHVLQLLLEMPSVREGCWLREVRWRTSGRIWFGVVLLVCWWVYLEVMMPSLLAMPGLVPVGLVLYNSLHYGRITALGAKLVLAMTIPGLLAGGFLLLRRALWGARTT
jgi:hypothetical protein